MDRRKFLAATAAAATAATLGLASTDASAKVEPKGGAPFVALPELDATQDFTLNAQQGTTVFLAGAAASMTLGFDGAYLGPTLRMRRGSAPSAKVANATGNSISAHWHGLNVPSNVDGGSHFSIVKDGSERTFTLPVDQPAATLWYHTHVHGRTAPDVQAGLVGAIILDDDRSDALNLPSTAGVDDFVLVLQDKSFDADGRSIYDPGMMGTMHGVVGDHVLVNGRYAPVATVPSGLVRLRLINAGTAAVMRFELGVEARLIATDQGLLLGPVELSSLALAPGERAEIVLDASTGLRPILVVAEHATGSMGGMMGGGSGMMGMGRGHSGMGSASDSAPMATLIDFTIDPTLPAKTELASDFGIDADVPMAGSTVRDFRMESGMGAMNMMRQMLGGQSMTINGLSYDSERIDFTADRGSVETWKVSSAAMAHPFHAHGVRFMIKEPKRPEERGWKDTVLVDGERELLVEIVASSVEDVPFMFHCHILEHEDAGMMGQFLVA